MSDGGAILMIIVGAAICLFAKRRKPPQTYVEWTVVQVDRRSHLPRGLVNLIVIAGIVLFIYVMNH